MAENALHSVEDEGKTYSNGLILVAERALSPILSLKEMLLDLDGYDIHINPACVGNILEALLKQAESEIKAAESALDEHVGRLQFVMASRGYPGKEAGTIVGVTVGHKEAHHG